MWSAEAHSGMYIVEVIFFNNIEIKILMLIIIIKFFSVHELYSSIFQLGYYECSLREHEKNCLLNKHTVKFNSVNICTIKLNSNSKFGIFCSGFKGLCLSVFFGKH